MCDGVQHYSIHYCCLPFHSNPEDIPLGHLPNTSSEREDNTEGFHDYVITHTAGEDNGATGGAVGEDNGATGGADGEYAKLNPHVVQKSGEYAKVITANDDYVDVGWNNDVEADDEYVDVNPDTIASNAQTDDYYVNVKSDTTTGTEVEYDELNSFV